MTSERKIAANRNTAKKSTGPRSEAGRRRPRLNALRHGLAMAISSHPAYNNEIEAMARALVGDGGDVFGEGVNVAARLSQATSEDRPRLATHSSTVFVQVGEQLQNTSGDRRRDLGTN